MRNTIFGAVAAALCTAAALVPACGSAQPNAAADSAREAEFGRELDRFIRQLRASADAVPGTAVVAVHDSRTVFEKAYGVRDLASGAPLTLDTPMYNASVTKAYTGLLAAMLDAEGRLPLDASLEDIWPEITLPAPLDAETVTIRKLLSHSSGIRAGGLSFRSVVTGQITAADVPLHLARYAAPQEPGFVYDNLGPFVWSAMAEKRTGKSWHALLRARILEPLGLRRTSSRLEELAEAEVSRCHPRRAGRWGAGLLKPTPVLNSAGGIYASPRDEATFLKAFVSDGRSVAGRIPPALLRRTWQKESHQDRNIWGLHRDGYGLGWDLGTIAGYRFVSRSGGYPGCRATSMFFPEHKLGVVVMSNGDAGANLYHAAILAHAIEAWTKPASASGQARGRIGATHAAMAQGVSEADAVDPRLAAARPTGTDEWQAALGAYRSERLGDMEIVAGPDMLRVVGGVFSGRLRHLGGDRFLLVSERDGSHESFDLIRGAGGEIVAFTWDDDRYDRIVAGERG